MSDDIIGIPPGFLPERAADFAVVHSAEFAEAHPGLGDDDVYAVKHALVEAYYAGAIALAAEINDQLSEASNQGRLVYRRDDGELVPLTDHLHIAQDVWDSDDQDPD